MQPLSLPDSIPVSGHQYQGIQKNRLKRGRGVQKLKKDIWIYYLEARCHRHQRRHLWPVELSKPSFHGYLFAMI